MLFDDDDYGVELGFFNIPGIDFNMDNEIDDLYSNMDGFMRGNMFKDLYEPYKNYTYLPLIPKTEKEKKLYEVMALSFALNDLNLYLDLNPSDTNMFNKFKKVIKDLKIKQTEYEKEYGPLELCCDCGNKYAWVNSPWPWEDEGGSMYV